MVVNQEGVGLPLKPIKTGSVGVDQDKVAKYVSTAKGPTVPYRYSAKRERLSLLIVVVLTILLSVR